MLQEQKEVLKLKVPEKLAQAAFNEAEQRALQGT
jgi:hypothetical protein